MKTLRILAYVFATIAIGTGIPSFFVSSGGDFNWKLFLEIASLVSITVDVALSVTINFNINQTINKTVTKASTKIKEEYDVKIKSYELKLEDYSSKITVLTNNVSTVINNFSTVPAGTNHDQKAMDALERIFKPIENLLANDFCLDNPFPMNLFDDFELFAKDMGNSNYIFKDPKLYGMFLDLVPTADKFYSAMQCSVTNGPQPGMLLGLYRKYDQAFRHGDKSITESMVQSAKRSCDEFHKLLIEMINKYRDIKTAFIQRH